MFLDIKNRRYFTNMSDFCLVQLDDWLFEGFYIEYKAADEWFILCNDLTWTRDYNKEQAHYSPQIWDNK